MSVFQRERPVIRDPEVVELFAGDPELLALADAITATRPRVAPREHSQRSWRLAPAAVASALAAFLLFVGLPSLNRSPGLVEQALAAVAEHTTLHVVLVSTDPGISVVDLQSSATVPGRVQVETWFDERSSRLRLAVKRDGMTLYDEVVSRPLAATGLRELAAAGAEPASAALFVASYERALRANDVDVLGDADLSGRKVTWLAFERSGAREQRVALDTSTKLPVALRADGASWHVDRVETVAAVPAKPAASSPPAAPAEYPSHGKVAASARSTLRLAAIALGEEPPAPARVAGLKRTGVLLQKLTRGFPSGRQETSRGVEIGYGAGARRVRVRAAVRPEPAYGFVEGRLTFNFTPIPPPGKIALAGPRKARGGELWVGQLRAGSFYVTVLAPSRTAALAVGRALSG